MIILKVNDWSIILQDGRWTPIFLVIISNYLKKFLFIAKDHMYSVTFFTQANNNSLRPSLKTTRKVLIWFSLVTTRTPGQKSNENQSPLVKDVFPARYVQKNQKSLSFHAHHPWENLKWLRHLGNWHSPNLKSLESFAKKAPNAKLHPQNQKCFHFFGTYNWQNEKSLHFLWNAKLCKWRKQKKAHIMQNFYTISCGQLHFNFGAKGCQYLKGPQLRMVH